MKRIVSMLFLALFSLIVLGVGSAWAQTSAVERAKVKFGPNTQLKAPALGLPRITGASSVDVYVVEDFEGGVFPPAGWTRINPDTSYTWEDTSASSYGVGASSAFVNNYDYSTAPALDSLITPTITGVLATDSIKFDYAYTDYSASFSDDSLFVDISTDNGATWTSVWREGGAGLRTRPSTTAFFIPTPSEWATKSLPVPAGVVGANVKVAFVSRSNYGNNLFIDQVRIGNPPPPPLSGSKTIGGTTPDYATVKAAIQALNSFGVQAPGVTFLIRGGTYTEDSLRIRTTTSGATAPIVFKPDVGATVVINVSPPNTTYNFAIKVDTTQYVTFDGSNNGTTTRDMTVNAVGINGQRGIWVSGASHYATIKNCNITAGRDIAAPTTAVRGIDFLYTGTAQDPDFVLAENNYIRYAYTGIRLEGNLAGDVMESPVVRNNVIDSIGNAGVYTLYHNDARIYGNDVNIMRGSAATMYGIFVGSTTARTRVYSNRVHDINQLSATSLTYGIYASGTSTLASHAIFNNFVWGISSPATATGAIYGIYDGTGNTTIADTIAYNTVALTGTSTGNKTTAAFFKGSATGPAYVYNNVLQNTRTDGTTGVAVAIYKTTAPTVLNSNNNDLYVGTLDAQHFTGRISTTNYATIADWRTANVSDVASFAANPPFVSATDLHIQTAVPTQIESGGAPIAGIATDIDGDSRNATAPDVGADEFAGIGIDLSPPAISYLPFGNNGVTATRTLATTIADLSGVQLAPAGAPRIYYKKGVGGTYFAAQATTIVGADFTFTVDYTNVGGIVVGDTIYYYVGAQDNLNNAGTNPAGGSGIDPPGNVPPVSPNSYRIVPIISSFPYVQDFEGGAGDWTSAILSGTVNDWILGTPAKVQIIGAHSGVNAWVTDLDTNYQNNQNAYVLSPLLNLSSFTEDPSLSFWHNFNMELNWEGAVVEMSTDGGSTFSRVGVLNDPLGSNWYNNSSTNGPVTPPKWSASSTAFGTGYVESSIRLTGAGGQALVYVRFRFGSDGSVNTPDGWAFDDVRIGLPPPLSGSYTIGSGGNYATLSQAVAALQTRGVSAPVTFLFTDAAYTDTAQIIGGYVGQGLANMVTFKPSTGVTARVLFTGGTNSFGFRADSASGITFDGSNAGGTDRSLTLDCDTIAPSRNVFLIRKGSNNLTFKNLILKGNRRSASNSNDVFRMDNQTFAASGAQHDITVDNCQMMRGLGGIFARGASGAVLDFNLTFTRNLVGGGTGASLLDNLAGTGILLEANRNVLVDQNDINGIKVGGATPQGVRIQGANDGVTMTRNTIHNIVNLSGAFRPICLLIGNIVATGPAVKTRARVENNMIYDIHNFGTGGSGRAVDGVIYNPTGPPNSVNGNGSYVEYYNNTWHFDMAAGEGTGATAFVFDGNFAGSNNAVGLSDSIIFKNNIASAVRADSLPSRMFLMFGEAAAGNLAMQSNNNVFNYTTGPFAQFPSPWPNGTTNLFATALQDWRDSTLLDLNSAFGNPQFVSATNAHILTGIPTPVESGGQLIAGITRDIDNELRFGAPGYAGTGTAPDAGADEGEFGILGLVHDIGVSSLSSSIALGSTNGGARSEEITSLVNQRVEVFADGTERVVIDNGTLAVARGQSSTTDLQKSRTTASTEDTRVSDSDVASEGSVGVGTSSAVILSPVTGVTFRTLADTVLFQAIVRNFGGYDEPSYQVSWSIDGVTQATISNSAILEVGDTDTLTFQWNNSTPGQHTAMAWTVLGTDGNAVNDSASRTFTIIPPATPLYDNGPLSTGALTRSGVPAPAGTTWSEVQSANATESNTNAGFAGGHTGTSFFRLTDDFVVPAGQEWRIDSMSSWAYQTGNSGITSPFTSLNVRIWQGRPGDVGSTVIYGDTTTNHLTTSVNAAMYRIFNTTTPPPGTVPGTTRPLWKSQANLGGVTLGPGTYWLDWQTEITALAAHFAPSVTVVNRRGNAAWNARQQTAAGWIDAIDAGNPATAPDSAQDFPFILYGESTALPTPGWTNQTSGTTTVLQSTKQVNSSVAWVAGNGGVVLRTTNGGNTWSSVGGGAIGTMDLYAIDAISATTAFVTGSPATGSYLFRTTNAGASWDTVLFQAGGFLNAIHMFDATNGIAVGDPLGGTWTVFRTSNGGASWARIATEPAQVGSEFGATNGLSVVGNNHIWFSPGTTTGRVYRSTDGGATWASSVLPFLQFTAGLAFSNTQYGVAGGSGGAAARTTDGGATWTTVTLPASGTVYGIAATNAEFFATRGAAIYRSTDRGATWASSYAGGVGALNHISAATAGANAYLKAVSATGGITSGYFSVTGVEDQQPELPAEFALMQNYPNPFNPTTTIRYALPKDAVVTLKVYNLLGQEVTSLRDEMQNVGFYDVVWNGRNNAGQAVSSGVYFYRLEGKPLDGSGIFTSFKKMLMLK